MYGEWFDTQGELHNEILTKLQARGLNTEQIIKYFLYDNMKEAEPDFCPLYKLSKKCHNIPNLNCYLCACSLFRFSDSTQQSSCSVNHKNAEQLDIGPMSICDCTHCVVPHSVHFIKNVVDKKGPKWSDIMDECKQ